MPFPIVPAAAIALTELAPSLIKWLMPENKKETKSTPYEVATKVIDIAHKVSGIHDSETAINALKKDPKLLLEFQQNVARFEKDLVEAETNDRESARKRDIALLALGRRNLRADIMVVCAAVGLIACLVSLSVFKGDLPGEAVGIISTVAGIFGACLKDAYAFEFGSSRGSKDKDFALFGEEVSKLKSI